MKRLFSPRSLFATLTQFYRKAMMKGQAYTLTQAEISLFEIMLFSRRFLRLLSKDLQRHDYQQSALHTRTIRVKNKKRVISVLEPIDQLVQSRLAQALSEKFYLQIQSSVYSYVPGKSALMAAVDFKRFLMQQRDDVYVLRADIVSYTDNIPLDATSSLWPKFEDLIDKVIAVDEDRQYLKK